MGIPMQRSALISLRHGEHWLACMYKNHYSQWAAPGVVMPHRNHGSRRMGWKDLELGLTLYVGIHVGPGSQTTEPARGVEKPATWSDHASRGLHAGGGVTDDRHGPPHVLKRLVGLHRHPFEVLLKELNYFLLARLRRGLLSKPHQASAQYPQLDVSKCCSPGRRCRICCGSPG